MILETAMRKFTFKICSEGMIYVYFVLFEVIKMQFYRDMSMQKE